MRSRRTRESGTVEMTPLVDVVFLLLIFFMVSTVFKKDELALLLNLPGADSGVAPKEKRIVTIELSEKEIALNGKKTAFADLEEKFKNLGEKDRGVPVDLRIDKSVRYERILLLVDLLKKHGLTNLSLISES